MSRAVFYILFLYTSQAIGTTVSLESLLEYQTSSQEQSELLKNKAQEQIFQQSPTHSLWLTTLEGSLELQSNVDQRFQSRGQTTTDSLPFNAQVRQNTPYGFSLNLDYRRELLEPEFLGTFTKERYRGTINFSLFNDFLGKGSRSIMSNLKNSNDIYEKKALADQCKDIALKYNEAFSIQENLSIIDQTINETKKILKGLRKASLNGAVNKTTVSLMEIDVENLKVQKSSTYSNKLRTLTELQNLTGYELTNKSLKKLKNPETLKFSNNNSPLQIEILEQELQSLKARLKKLRLDRNHDLNFYAGVESTSFAQNVINLNGQTDFGMFGLSANLRFSDQNYINRKKQIEAQVSIKKNEIRIAKSLISTEKIRYKETLNNFKSSYETLNKGLKTLKETERRSYKNFKSGRSSYNEYLTSRNEILRYKRSLVEALENYWNSYYNFYHFNGETDKLCMRVKKS